MLSICRKREVQIASVLDFDFFLNDQEPYRSSVDRKLRVEAGMLRSFQRTCVVGERSDYPSAQKGTTPLSSESSSSSAKASSVTLADRAAFADDALFEAFN